MDVNSSIIHQGSTLTRLNANLRQLTQVNDNMPWLIDLKIELVHEFCFFNYLPAYIYLQR